MQQQMQIPRCIVDSWIQPWTNNCVMSKPGWTGPAIAVATSSYFSLTCPCGSCCWLCHCGHCLWWKDVRYSWPACGSFCWICCLLCHVHKPEEHWALLMFTDWNEYWYVQTQGCGKWPQHRPMVNPWLTVIHRDPWFTVHIDVGRGAAGSKTPTWAAKISWAPNPWPQRCFTVTAKSRWRWCACCA